MPHDALSVPDKVKILEMFAQNPKIESILKELLTRTDLSTPS